MIAEINLYFLFFFNVHFIHPIFRVLFSWLSVEETVNTDKTDTFIHVCMHWHALCSFIIILEILLYSDYTYEQQEIRVYVVYLIEIICQKSGFSSIDERAKKYTALSWTRANRPECLHSFWHEINAIDVKSLMLSLMSRYFSKNVMEMEFIIKPALWIIIIIIGNRNQ